MVVDVGTRQQVLATIAARASTPLERLGRNPQRIADFSDPHLQARLERLSTQVRAENTEAMEHWLAQQGLNREMMIIMLSSPSGDEEAPLPAWTETLDEILDNCDGVSPSQDRCLCPTKPLPFEELLLPFVVYARQRLVRSAPEGMAFLAPEALASLERWLLSQLCHHAEQALYVAFYLFRATLVPNSHDWQKRTTQRTLYQAFVQRHQGEGLLPFFQCYSVLARLLVLLVEQWVESSQEFLQRLASDLPSLTHRFSADQNPGPVTEIISGCSDRHHNGRTVWLLTFRSGLKLVYKPRSLKVEDAFSGWLTWINTTGFPLPFREVRVLNRDSYGWMEYVEHVPCQSMQEVQRYYRRAGAMLCLLYVLGMTDIHVENLIANGEQPVLVDVAVYDLPHRLDGSPQKASSDSLTSEHSVLFSGMLPGKMDESRADQQMDESALGERSGQVSSSRWMHINTDAMSLSQVTINLPEKTNRVMLDGSIVRAGDYSEEIITGFRHMYRFLLEHRDELLTQDGPLSRFAGCPIRFVWRFTATYGKLLERLRHPKFLHNGADRWVELCILQKPFLQENPSSACWRLNEAEVVSLERLDVPFFSTRTDCRDLWTETGNKIPNALVRSAQEQMHAFLMRLTNEDMEQQVEIIRSSL